jgi:hypothetical protein
MRSNLLMLGAFALAGCGVEGTWTLDKPETKKATEAENVAVNPQAKPSPDFDLTLELESGGASTLTRTLAGSENGAQAQRQPGIWRKDGDGIVIVSVEGDRMWCRRNFWTLTCVVEVPDAKAQPGYPLIFNKS